MKRRILWRAVGAIVLALAALGSFNLAVWVVDRDPPIRYIGARALSESVEQGGVIAIEFDVFRERICDSSARRWLQDSENDRHAIPSFTVGLRLLAGREIYQRTITIPPAASPGPARYQVVLDYECNPLHRILRWPVRVYSPPIAFEIKEGEVAPEGQR